MRSAQRLEAMLWLAVYACGAGLAFLAGWRMQVSYEYFQLLGREPLASRLAESLFNLHAQPPLLNLLLGLALKLERATGLAPERSLLALHLALGAAITLALYILLVRLGVTPWLRRLALAVILLDPAFYSFVLDFFYPLHELFLLTLAAVAVERFLATRRPEFYVAACACLVALAYTRALFHPVWIVAVLLMLALPARRPDRERSPVFAALAASLVLLLAWPVKNYVRFGVFGFSSWQGYNLSQGLVDRYPPIWDAFVFGSLPSQESAREALARSVPERFRAIPVLADPLKAPGVPNWNHAAIIPLSRRLESLVLRRLREHPALLAAKAAENYRQAAIYPARNPYAADLDWRARTPLARFWLTFYESTVYLYRGDDPQSGPLPGFAWILPPALLLALVQIVRRRKRDPVGAGTTAFLLAAILWVLAMVLLVDGREGNRIRFSTQPLLYLAVAWSLTRSSSMIPETDGRATFDRSADRSAKP
ncbi:MAG TPA: hypothetical protein VH988_30710 [Thermoanaerobaculia bacterium]|jgi:hypothetical protein|nr:hypothetical protein [Thermoanaerobaculia bacterium]